MAQGESVSVQVVDGDGAFHADEVASFLGEQSFAQSRNTYQVVAIMGPQSSGKSTLLNTVFGTNFVMMDAMVGRSQTTKGIWMSTAPKLEEISTLVLDLEGSDGRERGEDDTNFERQSALFALAIADVLLVNVWCHDIGREQGSGKPLLKTIFQVNLKLFAPEPNRAKRVLLFVIRDKSRTPLQKLVEVMETDLDKMWDSIDKPAQYAESRVRDFFEVQYSALAHFEEKHEDFLADSVMLRRRFTPDGDDSLVRAQPDKLPADSLALSMQQIWEVIHSQKDLNLPAHKIMVANIRCAEIREQQLYAFRQDQAWQALCEESSVGAVPGFGKRAASLISSCIHGYDAEAVYFHDVTREEKRAELVSRLYAEVEPLYHAQAEVQRQAALTAFARELKVGGVDAAAAAAAVPSLTSLSASAAAPASVSGAKPFVQLAAEAKTAAVEQFQQAYHAHVEIAGAPFNPVDELSATATALDAHIAKVKADKTAAAMAHAEKQLSSLVSGPAIGLLEACPPNLWVRLHGVAREAAAAARKSVLQALDGYGLTAAEQDSLSTTLANLSAARLEAHVREASLTRLSRMKDRFTEVFTLDERKTPRTWGARDDISAIAAQARLAAAHVLSQLAVMRPAGVDRPADGDVVERAVLQLAADRDEANPTSLTTSNSIGNSTATAGSSYLVPEAQGSTPSVDFVDMQGLASWPGVDEAAVLLQPHEVRTSWREFVSASNVTVQQALATQQANRMANNRAPPLWTIAAIGLLGWNEAMAVLFSPVYLVLGIIAFLFLRTLYTELDVDREMGRGALPGALSLAHKIGPATRMVAHRTLESLQAFASKVPEEFSKLTSAPDSGVNSTLNADSSRHVDYAGGDSSPAAAGISSGGLARRRTPGEGQGAPGVQMTELRKEQ